MAMKTLILLFSFVLLHPTNSRIEEIPLPPEMQHCFDRIHKKANLTDVIGEKTVWGCVHGTLWSKVKDTPGVELSQKALDWFANLINKSIREAQHNRRTKRQANRRQVRIRREYRMIPDVERNLFHRAIVMLKADTSIPPNRYDALGRLHEVLGDRAHDGPNFLGWHRLFLIVAENALREKIPTVTIPYWDSTLDGGLIDPRSSIIWTPEFMGNGNGRIITGPFSGWATPETGPLVRNFGDGGTMMNWTSIRDTFTRSHIADITHPNADPLHNIEDHHGEPHLWVGGHMSPQALAGYDPIFILHHSFIDLVWELFRRLQRRRGVDPTTDYPRNNTGPAGHGYDDPSGFGNLRNRHALSDIFTTEMYTYQLPPTCTMENQNCGSPYIRCDVKGPRPRCISASIFDIPPDQKFSIGDEATTTTPRPNRRGKRSVLQDTLEDKTRLGNYLSEVQYAMDLKCQPENVNEHYVNNYNIDGVTDQRRWVYIAIGVIYKDSAINSNSGLKNAATYPKCQKGLSLPRRVFIESNGLNYRGFFKDIVNLPTSVPVTSTVKYIAVKSPAKVKSELIISAYDMCGRVCRPYCRTGSGNRYTPCAGALRVTRQEPKLYGDNVTSVSADLWDSDDPFGIPAIQEEKLFIKVVCDEGTDWPWNDSYRIP